MVGPAQVSLYSWCRGSSCVLGVETLKGKRAEKIEHLPSSEPASGWDFSELVY